MSCCVNVQKVKVILFDINVEQVSCVITGLNIRVSSKLIPVNDGKYW